MLASTIIMPEQAWIQSDLLANHGITSLFSLRQGGISPPPFDQQNLGSGIGDDARHVEHNLTHLIHSAGLPCPPHQTHQVHGVEVIRCNGSGRIHNQAADILMTDQVHTPVAVRTADCLPILLADPSTGHIAAVHAGWRGTANRIATRAIDAMIKHGANRSQLLVWLAPCIGSCCFAIGDDTAETLIHSVSGADACMTRTPQLHADLRAINRLQLLEAGITDPRIDINHACTACDPARFFSYRRDHGHTGRHLAIIATG